MFHVEQPKFRAHPITSKKEIHPKQVQPNVPRGTLQYSNTAQPIKEVFRRKRI